MVAAMEVCHALPGDVPPPSVDPPPTVPAHRVVAIAVTARELLRPGSDLARAVDRPGPVDLLVVCADGPDAENDTGDDAADDAVCAAAADELRAAVHALGIAGLALHRLALPVPLTGAAEGDLVAALSELVGFDPDPGVTVLAPAPAPGDLPCAVADRAARRITEVYGLSLHQYRVLEPVVAGGAAG